jgi:NAD(P)-dependent dehydrogenase (short-subunit alcohol dehydrogenase family)
MKKKYQFYDLEGKHLLITGVTSGIGRALLPELLRQGMNLVVVSRGMDRMLSIREELQVPEERMQLYDCDLSNPDAVELASDRILRSGVALDGVFHNAGIDTREHFSRSSEVFWSQLFQVNLFSAVTLTRKLLPVLRRSPQGRILFTGSVMFELGGACLSAYAASKGALVGLTRSLAHELKNTTITVNCIVPGAIAVGKTAGTRSGKGGVVLEQSVSRQLHPTDLAGLLCLLLSEAGGAICGQAITVDGGLHHSVASPERQGARLVPPWPIAGEE